MLLAWVHPIVISVCSRSSSIIFVHGFQGHPRDTWTHAKKRSLFKGISDSFKKHQKSKGTLIPETTIHSARAKVLFRRRPLEEDGETELFWPQALLPKHFPRCRILSFGYNSHVTKSKLGILEHGSDLLNRLEAERKDQGRVNGSNRVSSRKIIFVAHSLGGLVVKEVCIEYRNLTILLKTPRLTQNGPCDEQRVPYNRIILIYINLPLQSCSLEHRIEDPVMPTWELWRKGLQPLLG